jgi:hypothetical protein
MFFEETVLCRRNVIPVLLILLAVTFGLAGSAQYANALGLSDLGPDVTTVKMSFHMYGTVYMNSNSSIFIYNGADTNLPTYSTAPTTMVSCAIHQSFQSYFPDIDAWVGIVSWITQPVAEETTIQGDVNMTVWMSTDDSSPTSSGYGFALSQVDMKGSLVGDQFYQYTLGIGSVLGQSPTPYTLAFAVSRTFAKGSILAFFAVVGSTTQGWHYRVYFDSPSMDSFAELPITSTPVPEFSQPVTVACMILAMLCFTIMHRRKH